MINTLGPGGAERSLAESIQPLRGRGIDVEVATLFPATGPGVDVEVASMTRIHTLEGSTPSRIRRLRRLIGQDGFDLVHTTLFEADVIGRIAAVGRAPVLTSLVNTSYEPVRLEDPRIRRSRFEAVRFIDATTGHLITDHFHAITAAVASSATRRLRIPRDKMTIIPRGRDRARLGTASQQRRSSVRAQLGISDEDAVILAVGRQEYQKGHEHLIDAFSQLAEAHPDALLLIAGRAGNATTDIQDAIARYDLGRRVRSLGHVENVPDLLVAADVLAFPSIYEGLGGTLIEALALGTPIVASDIAVTREVLGDAGMFVPPGNPEALAQQLAATLDDPDRGHERARRGQRRFNECFELSAVMDRTAELMRTVADSKR